MIVDMIDINGDGKADRVMRSYGAPFNKFKVQMGTGAGFEVDGNGQPLMRNWNGVNTEGRTDSDWNSISSVDTGTRTKTRVTMNDMNGDGLMDRVFSTDAKDAQNRYQFAIQYNNGRGFEPVEYLGPLDTQGQSDGAWRSPTTTETSNSMVLLLDMNGDGLADRLMVDKNNVSTNPWKVQINTGYGFMPQSVVWSNSSGYLINYYNNNGKEVTQDLQDITGDGIPDSFGFENFRKGSGIAPDLLNKIQNGLGGTLTVNYAPSTQFNNRDRDWTGDPWDQGAKSLLPFPVWVVSSVAEDNGMGLVANTSYSYKGGFFNFGDREFRGFAQVTRIDPANTKITTYFHQGGGRDDATLGEFQDQTSKAKQGLPYRTDVWDANNQLLSISLNKVEETEVMPGTGWYFPRVTQKLDIDYTANGGSRAIAMQMEYDNTTGNVVRSSRLGEVSVSNLSSQTFTNISSLDDVHMRMTYATISGKPDIISHRHTVTVCSDAAGNNPLRTSRTEYDSRGNPEYKYLNDTLVSRTEYDVYGNPERITDAADIVTVVVYDPVHHTFPKTVTRGPLSVQNEHDPLSGQILNTLDQDGYRTRVEYDAFFRSIETFVSQAPTDAQANHWISRTSYHLGGIVQGKPENYIIQKANDGFDNTNGIVSRTYMDGLGRAVQRCVEAETAGLYRSSSAIYDKLGRVVFETDPQFVSSIDYKVPDASEQGTTAEYDALGRPRIFTPPRGEEQSPTGPTTLTYGHESDPWTVGITDAEGRTRRATLDGFGRVVNVIQNPGTDSTSLTYAYDRLGQVTKITAPGGETNITYDAFGQKQSTETPDTGLWSYQYDTAGRLKQQDDAKGNRILLKYDPSDPLGRLTSKEVYGPNDVLQYIASYSYDSAHGDSAHPVFAGQLARVTDSQGWERYGYDFKGNVLKQTRHVQVVDQTYSTSSTYDDLGRLSTLTYPNNSAAIEYIYGNGGVLQQIRSTAGTGTTETFFSGPTFDALGRMTGLQYGNGATTTYNYYANSRRLKKIQVSSAQSTILDLTYTHKPGGQVASILDAVGQGSASLSVTHIRYDSLYRLVGYNTADGDRWFNYTASGNIKTNTEFGGAEYAYGSPRPHAVTGANSKVYGYDANGNMTDRNGQILAYNAENQLVSSTAASPGATPITFGYDGNGQRLWKYDGETYTLWIHGIFEIRGMRVVGTVNALGRPAARFTIPGGTQTKTLCHVYAGTGLVASFEPLSGGAAGGGLWGNSIQLAHALGQGADWMLDAPRYPLTLTLLGLLEPVMNF